MVKLFSQFLNEGLTRKKKVTPKTREELISIIEKVTKLHPNDAVIDLNFIDTSMIVDMRWLFNSVKEFNYDISQWNVSRVENMSNMFLESKFTGDISQWDVSRVKHMGGMFWDSEFNGDISKWNVSRVENMSHMFKGSKFNGDISQWNVSKVEHMESMFEDSEFNGDISKWNVSRVVDMRSVFQGSKFTGDISQWDVSRVKHMSAMFWNSEFNGDISQWNVSNVEDMRSMFKGSKFNGDISQWDVSNVKYMMSMFEGSEFNGDLSQWDISSVEDSKDIFKGSKFKGDISRWKKASKAARGISKQKKVSTFNRNKSQRDVSKGLTRKVVVATTHDNPEIVTVITDPTPEAMAALKEYDYYFDECDVKTNLIIGKNDDELVEVYPIDANASNFKYVLTKQCQQCLDDMRKAFTEEGLGEFEGEFEWEDVPLIGYKMFDDVSQYRTGTDLLNDILNDIEDSEVDGDSSSASYIVNIDNGATLYGGKDVEVYLYTSDEFMDLYNE